MDGSQSHLTVADVAITRPASLTVFYDHHIDFCCEGSQLLTHACQNANVSITDLWQEIAAVEARQHVMINWDERPLVELLHHLLTRFHDPERITLQRLAHLADQATRAHPRATEGSDYELTTEVFTLTDTLSRHMVKEEQVLFPWIASGRGSQAMAPITAMLRDHNDTVSSLSRIRTLTNDFHPPERSSVAVESLYAELATFDRELRVHIHLENNVLFPRALRERN